MFRNHIYGIDFSGAKDAGRRIWISKARVQYNHLLVEDCFPAYSLPGSDYSLKKCLPSLRQFIAENTRAVFGLDFPFGLPARLVAQTSWREFIIKFPNVFRGPDHFRKVCYYEAGNKEFKRNTDIQNRAPFSPYNLRLYKQTYYGIKEIAHPLVLDRTACFLPMQKVHPQKPWVLEVCPASTLKSIGLYRPYKNSEQYNARANTRYNILTGLMASAPVRLDDESVVELAVADRKGDVLDSIIACYATFLALKKGMCKPPPRPSDLIEGAILGAFDP